MTLSGPKTRNVIASGGHKSIFAGYQPAMLPGPKACNVIAWAGGPGNGCCFLWRPARPKQIRDAIDPTGCGLAGRERKYCWAPAWALGLQPTLSHYGLSEGRTILGFSLWNPVEFKQPSYANDRRSGFVRVLFFRPCRDFSHFIPQPTVKTVG